VYKSPQLRVAGYLLLIVGALATFPVYLLGSESEDVLENLPGIAKPLIAAHEDAATISLAIVLVTGILAAISWFMDVQEVAFSRVLTAITFAAALLALGSFGYTALLGGQIRHSEFRPVGDSSVQTGQSTQQSELPRMRTHVRVHADLS
jgi:uncharacterized BrkB/YihY/UPF0761 family membrane protein